MDAKDTFQEIILPEYHEVMMQYLFLEKGFMSHSQEEVDESNNTSYKVIANIIY